MSSKVVNVILEEKESKSPKKEKEIIDNVVDTKKTPEKKSNHTNGEVEKIADSSPSVRTMTTRSASTSQSKNHSDDEQPQETVVDSNKEEKVDEDVKSTENTSIEENVSGNDGEAIEESTDNNSSQDEKINVELQTTDEYMDSESYMDPLVLQNDEPCPELEFEESSDKDSGKYSPIISRCVTRRSQNRNIPTPKTPKSIDEQESEKDVSPTPTPEFEDVPKITISKDFNETDSLNTDNLSTKVQVGSDATRAEFSEGESEFLVNLKNKDKNSFPRVVSSRKSIKSIREDIRMKSFRNSIQRANLSIPFFSSRDSVERAPSVKRKSRSETPEDRKRFKVESSSVFSKITSPFSNLKNKFGGSPTSTSTPKLTSYRDQRNHLGGDFIDQMGVPGGQLEPEKKWCTIM